MPSPSRTVIRPPQIPSPTPWTVSSVRQAIDDHEIGLFSESAKLARAFGRDERISPCRGDRVNALIGGDAADFSLQPVDSAGLKSRSTAAIKRISEWYDEVVTDAWARKTLFDGIDMGFSLSHVPWVRTKTEWRPSRPTRWEPEFTHWDHQRHCYIAQTEDGQQIEVRHGDPNWFIYEPDEGESWMSGAVRAMGIPFLMRQWDYRDWARYNERHGLPIITIKEPSGERDPGEKESFYAGVKAMGQRGIIRLPQGVEEHESYGVDLMEAKARSFDSFDKFLDRLNIAIAIFYKGQNLTTEVSAGAYASTGWHMRVRKDYAENDAKAFGAAVRKGLFNQWGRYNFDGWEDKASPWPAWNLEIPEDQAQVATALAAGAQAIGTLMTQPQAPLIDWPILFERLGIPLIKGAKFELKEPVAVPAPPAPGEDDPDETEEDDEDGG